MPRDFNVKLIVPTWDGNVHFSQVPMLIRETSLSRHLVDIEYMAHMPVDRARFAMTEQLLESERNLDMVIMLDADQSAECSSAESETSWIDRVVSQYVNNSWPYIFLVGVTPMSHDETRLNIWYEGEEKAAESVDTDRPIRQCGSGLLAIAKQPWLKLSQYCRHKGLGNPWFPAEGDMDPSVSEDIRMTRRAVAAGIKLVPMEGIRVLHWPTWRRDLQWTN